MKRRNGYNIAIMIVLLLFVVSTYTYAGTKAPESVEQREKVLTHTNKPEIIKVYKEKIGNVTYQYEMIGEPSSIDEDIETSTSEKTYEINFGAGQPLPRYPYNVTEGNVTKTGEMELVSEKTQLENGSIVTQEINELKKQNTVTRFYNADGTEYRDPEYSWDNSGNHPTFTDDNGNFYIKHGDVLSTDIIRTEKSDGTYTTEQTFTATYISVTETKTKVPYSHTANIGVYKGNITFTTKTYTYTATYSKTVISIDFEQKNIGETDNKSYVQDPVNIITGNLYDHYTDLSMINIGPSIEAKRYYSALDDRVSVMGKSWRFHYDSFIQSIENSQDIRVVYPSGRANRFYYIEETSTYKASADILDTLTKESDGSYVLTLKNKQKYIYGINNKLSKIIDLQGNTTSLIYDSNNNLTKVDAGEGKYITLNYSQGRIQSITDSIGRTVTYEYNDDGMLSKVTDASGESMTYEYDDNLITAIFDRNGNATLRNEYDTIDRVIRQIDGHGGVIEYNYDLVNRENYYHNVITGEKITYQYDLRYNITKKIYEDGTYEEYTYDDKNNRIAIRNRNGKTTRFEYDDRNNIIKIISPAPYNYQTMMTYNDMDKVTTVQLPNGVTNTFIYDESGNVLTISKPIDETRTAITRFTYDALGRKITETNPLGYVTHYEYNSTSPIPVRVVDPEGNSTTFTHDNANRVKTVTKGSNTITYDYNYQDKITKITDPYGNVTRMKYDSMGNVIKTIRANNYNSQSDDGIGDVYYYNSMNKPTHVVDAMGNITGITRYDAVGNISKMINPDAYNEATGDGEGQKLVYDNEQRLIKTITPSGDTSRIKYDSMGNVTKAISASEYNEQIDDGEGLSYTYDVLNRLASIQDKDGNTILKNTYDSTGKVIKAADAEGYETLYEYNKAGWLTGKKEPLKEENGTIYYRQSKYEYDSLGRVIKEYKSNEYVQVNTDATLYNVIAYTYNKNNQVMSVKDSTGAYTKYYYDHLSRLTKQESLISHELYNIKRYEYDKLDRVIKEIRVMAGEDIGSSSEYEEAITTYSYDKNGNLVQVISPLGYKTTFSYNANNQIVKKEEEVDKDWLNANHVKAEIYSPKNKIYEDNVYTYQLRLNSDKPITSAHFELLYDSRIFEYVDTDGLDDSMSIDTNTIGKIIINTNKTYDIGKSDVLSIRMKTKSQLMGLGYITFSEECYYVDQEGNQKKFTELTGQRLNMLGPDYNENHKVEINDLTLAAKQAEQGVIPRFKYTYDTNNDGIIGTDDLEYMSKWLDEDKSSKYQMVGISQIHNKIINNDYVTGTDKVIRETHYKYNKSGELIEESDADGTISYTYDLQNNLIEISDKEGNISGFTYNGDGKLIGEIKSENYNASTKNGAAVTYRYDYLGRVTHIFDEDNALVRKNIYDIKGCLVAELDAKGYQSGSTDNERYKTEYTYDIGGRVISVMSPEAKDINKANINYTYDAQDNVITIQDGEGNTTTYYRDLWGRATSITDGAGYISTYEYDYAGNVISSTDPKGNTTQYFYNSLNKLKMIVDPMDGEIHYIYDRLGRVVKEVDRKGQVINYQYNSEHNLTQMSIQGKNDNQHFLYNQMGRLFATISNNGIEGYSYTPNGLIKSKSIGADTQLSYTYNKNNQLQTLTDKDSYIVNYQYDKQARLSNINDINGTIATYTYNNNLLSNVTYKNNNVVNYSYNKDNQVERLTHSRNNDSFNTFEYDYNLNGNIIQKQENGLITRYKYDQLNQLTKVNYPDAEESFSYDIAGNRTKRKYIPQNGKELETSYQYNALNQLTRSVENDIITTYGYDDNGNLLKSVNEKLGTVYYSYDGYNRLTNVTNPDGSYQNNYYTVGKIRRAIEENGVYSGFSYHNGQVINEYTSHGEIKQTNIIGDRLVASKGMSGDLNYYLHNAHGDVTTITDKLGKMVNNYNYDAYGNVTSSVQLIKNRYTYAGEQLDSITGQYYLRARYYDPKVGRFMQEDSYRGDGLNLYAYVGNNPVNFIDPSGYCKESSADSSKAYIPGLGSILINTELLGTSELVGYFEGLNNPTLNEILSRVPADAQQVAFKPINDITKGFKFRWKDAGGIQWELYGHESSPTAPTGSNSSKGWIYRVKVKNGKWVLGENGVWYKRNVLNDRSPYYSEEAANATHRSMQTPENEKDNDDDDTPNSGGGGTSTEKTNASEVNTFKQHNKFLQETESLNGEVVQMKSLGEGGYLMTSIFDDGSSSTVTYNNGLIQPTNNSKGYLSIPINPSVPSIPSFNFNSPLVPVFP